MYNENCVCFKDNSAEIHYKHCYFNRNCRLSICPFTNVLRDWNISQTLRGLLVDPQSANIRTLIIQDTDLTEIPREIFTFSSQLEKLQIITDFSHLDRIKYLKNNISTIHHGAIHCSPALRWLTLSSIELKSIEPGAFEGGIFTMSYFI